MRRNFAQILKDAKIDIKVEYQKLYGMLYDRSIQVSNTNRISVYDELSTFFIAFHFRGTCLSLDEFNDLHGFHFEKDPTNFNIDHLISLCEYIENLLMAYQCVPLSYPYGYGNMPTKLINVQFYLQQISQVIEKIGYMQAEQNDMDNLIAIMAAAGCTYVMGIPEGDDVMLMYQTTGFHDIQTIRELFGLHPIREFERWAETMGILENGRLTARAGDPTIFQ